jgi:16S rRNA (uracil1498-N3)-methyltransferase
VGHLPHVFVAPPWGSAPDGADATLTLDDQVRHHLEKVLRRTSVAVTYTDGLGTVGSGRFESGRLHRGAERMEPAPTPHLTVAVAPPRRTERVRFVVEKLAELGVARLRWIRTAHTVGRPPHPAKAAAWAVGALEQSRGAHLLEMEGTFDPLDSVSPGTAGPGAEDAGGVVYADVGGGAVEMRWIRDGHGSPHHGLTVVVGPEGGFADGEIPASADRLGLGDRVLRTETAAVVAAALILAAARSGG